MVWLSWCKVGRDILVILAVEVKSWVSFKSLVKVSQNLFEQAAELEILFYGAHHPSNNSDGSPNDGLGRWCSDQKMGSLKLNMSFQQINLPQRQRRAVAPSRVPGLWCTARCHQAYQPQGLNVCNQTLIQCIETPAKIDKCVFYCWVLNRWCLLQISKRPTFRSFWGLLWLEGPFGDLWIFSFVLWRPQQFSQSLLQPAHRAALRGHALFLRMFLEGDDKEKWRFFTSKKWNDTFW